jgi:hypothetical protein
MTKHVSPEITGAELRVGVADYKRPYDGATMRWDGKLAGGIGSFNAVPDSFKVKRDTQRDNSAALSKDSHRPVMSELESLEQAMKESPRGFWLTSADQFLVAIAATLIARYRIDELKSGDVSLLIGLLGKLGFSPRERGALNLPTDTT